MDKESFLETLKTQYTEEIREVYLECEHNEAVDIAKLEAQLKKLMKGARAEGLPSQEFEDLVKSNLPENIFGKLGFLMQKAG